MGRVPRLTRAFLASLRAAGVQPGTEGSRRVTATVRALAEAEDLPGPSDYPTLIPPVRRAWVRRVPGEPLWLFYRVSQAGEVQILGVTRSEPPAMP